jgi:hypothetical protein
MVLTPFEHVVVVAVATKETGEVTVAPLLGLLTVTVAKAGAANDKSTQTKVRILLITGAFWISVGMWNRNQGDRSADSPDWTDQTGEYFGGGVLERPQSSVSPTAYSMSFAIRTRKIV